MMHFALLTAPATPLVTAITPLWEFVPVRQIAAPPAVVGHTVLAFVDYCDLALIDLPTGEVLRQVDLPDCVVVGALVILDGTVYVGSRDSHISSVDLAKMDVAWTTSTLSSEGGSRDAHRQIPLAESGSAVYVASTDGTPEAS